MSDNPNVTNVVTNKTSTLTRIAYFLLGVVVSAVLLYAVPSTGTLATNAVGSVVSKAPTVAENVSTWVSDTASSIGNE